MSDAPAVPRKLRGLGQLTVSERLLETLWGLLIVLSVTGSAQVAAGATSRQIFTLGLITGVAWAFVEGVMQIIEGRVERIYTARLIARASDSPGPAEPELARALDNSPVQHLAPEDRARVLAAVVEAAPRAPPPDLKTRAKDLRGGAETFLTLWGATLAPLAPFLLIPEARAALLYSQVIGVSALFGVGVAWGRYSEQHPLRTGGLMALIGLGLSGMLQALGA